MRDEMSALRITVESSIAAMKRDYDMKLSGRDFTGTIRQIGDKVMNLEQEISHIRNDWLETITPRITKLEEDNKDVKDIAEIIKYDDKLTGIKETMNTIKNVEKKTKDMIDTIEAKLKEDFNLDTDNMNARINDVIDRIGEIQNTINERDGMPSGTPLPATGEDKIIDMMKEMTIMNTSFQEMIMKNITEKTKARRTWPRSQRRRQGETRESE